jgi:RHS repeat-associated protein
MPSGSVAEQDGHSASYAYDAVGRLSSIAAPNGEHVSFVWDAGGRLVEQRLNSGLRTTQTWFEDGSLKERKNLHGSTTRSSHLFTLDVQGRRATQSENIGGATKSWTYQYDNLDRLTSASDGTAETYAYDIWGNRRSKTRSGVMTAYLYDEAHRLTEIRSGGDTGALIGAAIHDADGHLTKLCEGAAVSKTTSDCTASGTGASALTLTWNALDHLQSATRTGANAIVESYAYDDAARRLSKTSGAATTHYLYDGDDIYAEWSGGSSSNLTGVPTAVYIHGAGTDNPILRLTGSTNTPSATQLAYLQDGLGSVVGMATPAGVLSASQRFDAWGNRTTGSGSVAQYGYTGREPDATGLTYYRARYYHAGLGRFLSRDPAGMADSVSPYAYVANNPVNLVDPFGLQAQLVTPSSQSSYPQTVQVAFCLPCMQAATTMTDVIAGAIGGSVGNQSLHGGRGAGSNVDPLAPQRDSGSGSSNIVSEALGQLGGFANGALTGLARAINSYGKAIDKVNNILFGNVLNQGANNKPQIPSASDIPNVDWDEPSKPPRGSDGKEWEWRGKLPQGGAQGGYVNPTNPDQSVHPDLGHPDPVGPHWDFTDRGKTPSGWRIFPDGSIKPK